MSLKPMRVKTQSFVLVGLTFVFCTQPGGKNTSFIDQMHAKFNDLKAAIDPRFSTEHTNNDER